jgi:integrase
MAWVEKHGSGFRVRYRLPDGSVPSEPGFGSYRDAAARALDVESEQRTGAFVDPRLAQTLVGEWVRQWAEVHDVSAGTWAKYDAHLRNHILPRFGATALGEVSRMTVKGWVKSLRRSLAEATVADVVSLLSTIFNEAVDEGLIGANPCRRLRVHTGEQGERPHASAAQIPVLTARASFMDGVMIITAAYTGMRWGELAGLQWVRTDLDTGSLVIDAKDGALHEVNGTLELGPLKTKASARTVHLPPFLIALLGELHDSDPLARFVFTAPEGGWHRRANFRRRVWLPAVAGDPQRGWTSIAPGLHFHDLRHTHKTWLIEDDVPEVLQCKRLGHRLHGVRGIYSHVTQPMTDAMLAGLQRRWEQCGSTNLGDHYRVGSVVKISCSHNAPTTQKQPVGDDHQQAV